MPSLRGNTLVSGDPGLNKAVTDNAATIYFDQQAWQLSLLETLNRLLIAITAQNTMMAEAFELQGAPDNYLADAENTVTKAQ